MAREIDPEANEVAYSLPLPLRIGVGAYGIFAGILGILMLWFGFSGRESRSTSPTAYVFLGVMALIGAGLFLWASGPRDLSIDMVTRRYRRRQGLPGLAHWETGSVEDIARIYIQRRSMRQGERYWLKVAWRDSQRKDSSLGMYRDGETALRHCRRLGERLGIACEKVICA
jgi:hypothetical protein